MRRRQGEEVVDITGATNRPRVVRGAWPLRRVPKTLAMLCVAVGFLSTQKTGAVSPAAAAPASAARTATFPVTVYVHGVTLRIERNGPSLDIGDPELLTWIQRAAGIVHGYYGYFPVKFLLLRVTTVDGSGVRNGHANVVPTPLIDITIGRAVRPAELQTDWVLVHEMIHFALPNLNDDHDWLAEGVATYVEGVARVQAGNMTAGELWQEYVAEMPKGLPAANDHGLDHTHSWASTYWGGALFCLLADVKIGAATHTRAGLKDALRAIGRSGGMTVHEDIATIIATGDAATGTTVLRDLYASSKDAPMAPDLAGLWRDLGIRANAASVEFDDTAPLAAVRRAITEPTTNTEPHAIPEPAAK